MKNRRGLLGHPLMNPKAENSCAERWAPKKIEKAVCSQKILKKILEANNITDPG